MNPYQFPTADNLAAQEHHEAEAHLRLLAETFLADNFHHYSESSVLNLMTLLASQSAKRTGE